MVSVVEVLVILCVFLAIFFLITFTFLHEVVQKWRVSKQQEMVTKKNDKLRRAIPLSSVTYEKWGLNSPQWDVPFSIMQKVDYCCIKGTSLVNDAKSCFIYIFSLLLFFIISIEYYELINIIPEYIHPFFILFLGAVLIVIPTIPVRKGRCLLNIYTHNGVFFVVGSIKRINFFAHILNQELAVRSRKIDAIFKDIKNLMKFEIHFNKPSYINNIFREGLEACEREDYSEAIEHLNHAASLGHTGAQYNLGVVFFYGKGTATNYSKACDLFHKAANVGSADAAEQLGHLYFGDFLGQPDYREAEKWYEMASGKNLVYADFRLGQINYNGLGRPKDLTKAFYYLEKAARNGCMEAMVNLGILYEKGEGVLFCPEKAFYWYSAAAEKGSILGVAYLGEAYLEGIGIKKDEKKGIAFLEQAAALQLPYAQRRLCQMDYSQYAHYCHSLKTIKDD